MVAENLHVASGLRGQPLLDPGNRRNRWRRMTPPTTSAPTTTRIVPLRPRVRVRIAGFCPPHSAAIRQVAVGVWRAKRSGDWLKSRPIGRLG